MSNGECSAEEVVTMECTSKDEKDKDFLDTQKEIADKNLSLLIDLLSFHEEVVVENNTIIIGADKEGAGGLRIAYDREDRTLISPKSISGAGRSSFIIYDLLNGDIAKIKEQILNTYADSFI